jgi:hypothetical protein
MTKFCTVAPNICGYSVRHLLSPFWRLQFEGDYIFLEILCAPARLHCRNQTVSCIYSQTHTKHIRTLNALHFAGSVHTKKKTRRLSSTANLYTAYWLSYWFFWGHHCVVIFISYLSCSSLRLYPAFSSQNQLSTIHLSVFSHNVTWGTNCAIKNRCDARYHGNLTLHTRTKLKQRAGTKKTVRILKKSLIKMNVTPVFFPV